MNFLVIKNIREYFSQIGVPILWENDCVPPDPPAMYEGANREMWEGLHGLSVDPTWGSTTGDPPHECQSFLQK